MNKIRDYIQTYGLEAFKMLCYNNTEMYEYACILDSCQLNTGVIGGKYELLVALGADKVYTSLDSFYEKKENHWIFGVLGYDLKNNIEKLSSSNTTHIETPDLLFFSPQILICIDKEGTISMPIGSLPTWFFNDDWKPCAEALNDLQVFSSKEEYIAKIEEIHQLIREGEVYELNYCLPFVQSFESLSPIQFHKKLLKKSPVPMASYLRANHLHLCGASMERYLCKRDDRLISQPIKGTIRKGDSLAEDELLIQELENSEKDRAENVMIVDLVRNDLARICQSGTIKVEELFGIYSYLQVHQMISTVVGQVKPNTSFIDILNATFPMGSMTGAPKIAAMKEIEKLESFKRGWYSGAVGYIEPNGDFDFNVVIRSLISDTNAKKLMYCAGGAITIDSIAESEWDEIKLKTKAITSVLGN